MIPTPKSIQLSWPPASISTVKHRSARMDAAAYFGRFLPSLCCRASVWGRLFVKMKISFSLLIGYVWWFCAPTRYQCGYKTKTPHVSQARVAQRHTVFGARNQCEGSLSWCIVPQALSVKKRRLVWSLFDSNWRCHVASQSHVWSSLLSCLMCVMFCGFANEAIWFGGLLWDKPLFRICWHGNKQLLGHRTNVRDLNNLQPVHQQYSCDRIIARSLG